MVLVEIVDTDTIFAQIQGTAIANLKESKQKISEDF